MNKKQLAEVILEGLERQRFNDWYDGGDFEDYITGEKGAPSKEKILEDILRLFNLD